MRALAIALAAAAALAVSTFAGVATGQPPASVEDEFAGTVLNVLPPGQAGDLATTPHSVDQIPLYDGLTPKFDQITGVDLDAHFKPAIFGLGGQAPERVENPPGRPGLRIDRDDFGVPHVFGETRDDVLFGSGWVAAGDRLFLMELLRDPGRIAALDVPGLDPFALAASFRQFDPTQAADDFLSQQIQLMESMGPDGQRVVRDVRSFIDGVNAYKQSQGLPGDWREIDVLATAALVGAIFGRGGGDEARRSQFLSALRERLGRQGGTRLWNDLRHLHEPETSVSVSHPFHYDRKAQNMRGNAMVDSGSLSASARQASAAEQSAVRLGSNALLVGAGRSSSGHPLFVAGPQVGYFYPEILMEIDLHGGGIDARGVTFPGIPYVLLGRGKDFAWSATSAGTDLIDHYAEELCGDDTHYVFQGECREMTNFDVGFLGPGGGQPGRQLIIRETVHGPVIGYATVGGRRVAISRKRSTRGREAVSALGFADLNTNRVDSAESFLDAASKIEFTFNWFYADSRDIAMFSSGRLPIRPNQVDPGLPTLGNGQWEWQGFLPKERHPHVISPSTDVIVNWNNSPARKFSAADDNWAWGPIQRNQLLEDAVARENKHTLPSLVAAMNRAATQDLRTARVLPAIAAVLETGPAPNARAARMLELLKAWRAAGSSRLDRDLDDLIDDPGAAIMDAAWPRIAEAVMSPALGPQLSTLARLIPRDQNASGQGSAYQTGWYGYVDKDLRTLLGRPVKKPYATRFCGGGNLMTCRESLWAALDAAGADLEGALGPNPEFWRADATGERIGFAPGFFLQSTMRWTNRPTFQQVVSFSEHR